MRNTRSIFTRIVTTIGCLTTTTTAWRRSAPPAAVGPLPYSYRDFGPRLQHTNPFVPHYKNTTAHPWDPLEPPSYPGQYHCHAGVPADQHEFWLANVPHEGTSPFLANGSGHVVYRDVQDFGAGGDGVKDDSAVFNAAITCTYCRGVALQGIISTDTMTAGGRCPGGACGGTIGKPALIYVPAGTYRLASTVQLLINTMIIGDAVNPPTLKAASNVSDGFVLVNGYGSGQPSLNNFFIGVHNLRLDTTEAPSNSTKYALNWAVSQTTSLINVDFELSAGSQHGGLEMDGGSSGGGSGMFMGDLRFSGGMIGILFNNQQYGIRNVK